MGSNYNTGFLLSCFFLGCAIAYLLSMVITVPWHRDVMLVLAGMVSIPIVLSKAN